MKNAKAVLLCPYDRMVLDSLDSQMNERGKLPRSPTLRFLLTGDQQHGRAAEPL